MIHADDMGMCHSANRATIEVLEFGLVKAASIMMPCPWVREAAEYARTHPEADLGLHLTLTNEWKHYGWGPVAPYDQVPGLLSPAGYLWPTVYEVVASASADEVRTEIRAQIERALQMGIRPTHLDTHMGTLFARTDYAEAYAELALEYRIPCMMFPPTEAVLATVRERDLEYPFEATERLQAAGFPLVDYILPGAPGGEDTARENWYREQIAHLRPGLTILIIHCGYADEELSAITAAAGERDHDRRLFTSDGMRRYIERQGVKLVGWQQIAALLREQP